MELENLKYLIPNVIFDKPPNGDVQFNISYRVKDSNTEFIDQGVIIFNNKGENTNNKKLLNLVDNTDYEIKLSNEIESFIFYMRTGESFKIGDNPYHDKVIYKDKNIYLKAKGSVEHKSNHFDFLYPFEENKDYKFKNVSWVPNNLNNVSGNLEILIDKNNNNSKKGLVLSSNSSNFKLDIKKLISGNETVFRTRFGYSFYLKRKTPIVLIRFLNNSYYYLNIEIDDRKLYIRDDRTGKILEYFNNMNIIDEDRTIMNFPIEEETWYTVIFLGSYIVIIRNYDLNVCIMYADYNPFSGTSNKYKQYSLDAFLSIFNKFINNICISNLFKLNLPDYYANNNNDLYYIFSLINKEFNIFKFKAISESNNEFDLDKIYEYTISDTQYIGTLTSNLDQNTYNIKSIDLSETEREILTLNNNIRINQNSVFLDFENDYTNAINKFKNLFYVFSDRINKYKLETCDAGTNPNLIYGNGKDSIILESHGELYTGELKGFEYPERENNNYNGKGVTTGYKHGEGKYGYKKELVGSAIVFKDPLTSFSVEIEFKVPTVNKGVSYFFKILNKNIIYRNINDSFFDDYEPFSTSNDTNKYYKEYGYLIEFPSNLGVKSYNDLQSLYSNFNRDFNNIPIKDNITVLVNNSNDVENGVYRLINPAKYNTSDGWEKISTLDGNKYNMNNIRIESSDISYSKYNYIKEWKFPINLLDDDKYHKIKISKKTSGNREFSISIDDVVIFSNSYNRITPFYFMFGTHFVTESKLVETLLNGKKGDFDISHFNIKSIKVDSFETNNLYLDSNSSAELGLQTIIK